ncbi:hypothetical protein MBMB1_0482 [Methanobacterium sp. MB1]|nr:hypothetical protein MBMB1_0482 [Methanobacterium sp. MB1]
MGYLVCDKCGGYYELQPGESPDDFTDECDCGGKTRYVETLEESGELEELGSTITCPYCGTENPGDKKICKSCKKFLVPLKSSKTGAIKDPTPRSSKSKASILETWDKQSNPIKALSILGVCCVGLILILGISAMFSPDQTTDTLTGQTPESTSSDSSASDSSSDDATAQIQVEYSGEWAGAISDSSGTRNIDGSGTKTFQVKATQVVAADFQKQDNGTGTIKVSIVQNGRTLETQSSNAEYGGVAVSHSFI